MKIVRPKSFQPISKNAKRVFKGKVFDVYQWKQKLFDGSYATFEKLKRVDTVMIIAVCDDGKIVLTQQEQPGKKPFIGLVGGRVDKNETVLSAAKRELLEEAGLEAKTFELFDATQPVSKIEWCVFTLIAKGCRKIAEQKLDAGEKIKLMYVTPEDFLKILSGKNGKLDYQDIEVTLRLIQEKILKINFDNKSLKEFEKLLHH